MEELHKPVMLKEVLQLLAPRPGETYLDLTAGYAGHAGAVLRLTQNFEGAVLVDRDEFAANYLREKCPQVEVWQSDFKAAAEQLVEAGKKFDLILADFGVSSPQLDNSSRGFSFMREGPLDMRMDRSQSLTAAQVVNTWREKELSQAFIDYGEESVGLAKKHARMIVEGRPFNTTTELANLLAGKAAHTRIHPATKVFQAIRMVVNDELGEIEGLMPLLPELLNTGGRVAIITFHSLEDRIVKKAFREYSSLGEESPLKLLNKKPIVAEKVELVNNPRARSAKLRGAMGLLK